MEKKRFSKIEEMYRPIIARTSFLLSGEEIPLDGRRSGLASARGSSGLVSEVESRPRAPPFGRAVGSKVICPGQKRSIF